MIVNNYSLGNLLNSHHDLSQIKLGSEFSLFFGIYADKADILDLGMIFLLLIKINLKY